MIKIFKSLDDRLEQMFYYEMGWLGAFWEQTHFFHNGGIRTLFPLATCSLLLYCDFILFLLRTAVWETFLMNGILGILRPMLEVP